MDMPSYGDRTASTVFVLYDVARMLFMRFCAVAPSQRRVVTWLSAVSPDRTTSCLLSRNGCRRCNAPLKKYLVLLSSLEPANSSMLNGPLPCSRPSLSMMKRACSRPTCSLSKEA